MAFPDFRPAFRAIWSVSLFRALVWTVVGVLMWAFSRWAIQDILVFCAFGYALFHPSKTLFAWKSPAAIAFGVLLLHEIIRIPFSINPVLSFRDFVRMLEVYAGMYAVACVFNTPRKIRYALLYSAVAIALTLSFDLVCLYHELGAGMFKEARLFRPVLNHPNVAGIVAGASCLVFFYFFWSYRKRVFPAAACVAGFSICLLYQIVIAARGPQIAFAITCGLIGFLMPGWRRKAVWLVLAAVVAWGLITFAGSINRRMLEEDSMRDLSERTVVWSHTLKLSMERPWLGHGFGKRHFVDIYYSSDPPEAGFFFPHTHNFWLKIFFEYGWTGLILHAAAWMILAVQIFLHLYRLDTFQERLLPGTVGLLLVFVMIYGLGDFPDNIAQVMQYWLVPVALVLLARYKPGIRREEKKDLP